MDKQNYHVTIKGLFFDQQGRVMLVKESSGEWDLPGGRLEHGEDFHTALKRECQEEMGLDCRVLDAIPYWAWPAQDQDGIWKVMLCFRMTLPHLEFTPSDECVAYDFFGASTLANIPVVRQTQRLRDYLLGNAHCATP